MRTECQAIAGAGFLLQIDCPDLASARNNQYRHLTIVWAKFKAPAEGAAIASKKLWG